MQEIKIGNLSLRIRNGKEIVRDFTAVLHAGDKLFIIGEEGNGKTTLLKFIYDSHLTERYAEGTKRIPDIRIGYLEQQLDPLWENHTVFEFLFTHRLYENLDYEFYRDWKKIESVFAAFQLQESEMENRLIRSCSGGEKVKLQWIKLLIRKYDLLLLDEPTNDLDAESVQKMERILCDESTPMIVVSHDESLIRSAANQILHLEQIKDKTEMRFTYFKGSYGAYLSRRSADFARQKRDHVRTKREKESLADRLSRQHQLVENDLNRAVRDPVQGRLLAKKMKNIKAQEKRLEKMEITSQPDFEQDISLFFDDAVELHPKTKILDLRGQTLQIGDRVLIETYDFSFSGRTHVVITGDNGAGKTTLLKELYRRIDWTRFRVQYVPQNYGELLSGQMSVLDYLSEELVDSSKETRRQIMTLLGCLHFEEKEMRGALSDLSGGQKVKVLIALIALKKADVLVLDEITRNLSPLSEPRVRAILKDFKGAILSVSHDRKFIEEVGEQVYAIRMRKLVRLR